MSTPHPFHYCYQPFPVNNVANSVQRGKDQRYTQNMKSGSLLLSSMNTFVDRNGNVINLRRYLLLALYGASSFLSTLLFFFARIYCQVASPLWERCSTEWATADRGRQLAQLIPTLASCLILPLSVLWLAANIRRVEASCLRDYNFLEMPTAVLCSLLAGMCAVIEIHYNFEETYDHLQWNDKWALAAADAVILSMVHAGVAFALT